MDAKFAAILESLPPKAPRSRLEPYRELIREMRRQGRTYREIAQVLDERCQVQVAASTVHEFVSRRSRSKPVAVLPDLLEAAEAPVPPPASSKGELAQRTQELKKRQLPASKTGKPVFAYDESEPLRVRPTPSRKSEQR